CRLCLLLRLRGEEQRIPLALAELGALLRLGIGDVLGIDRDDAGAAPVGGHHYPIGVVGVHAEHGLEHLHHEFARRVVVVEQDDLPQGWPLSLRQHLGAWFDDGLAHRTLPTCGVDRRSIMRHSTSLHAGCLLSCRSRNKRHTRRKAGDDHGEDAVPFVSITRSFASAAIAGLALALPCGAVSLANDIVTIDRLVSHKSTVPAVAGKTVNLFVREKVPATIVNAPGGKAPAGKVVLFVHGGFSPATLSFDLRSSANNLVALPG